MHSLPQIPDHAERPDCTGPEWQPAFPDEPGLSPADERWYTEQVSKRFSDPAELNPGTLADLAQSIAGYLIGLGLQPVVRDTMIDFEFTGRSIRIDIEDIDARLDAQAPADDGMAFPAPVSPVEPRDGGDVRAEGAMFSRELAEFLANPGGPLD